MTQQTFWEWDSRKDKNQIEIPGDHSESGSLSMPGLSAKKRTSLRPKARQLQNQLEQKLGVVDLVITDNRRRMVSSKGKRNRLEIRVHHMFLGCSNKVSDAVADFVKGDQTSQDVIDEYVQANREKISFEPTREKLDTEGEHFDLEVLLDEAKEEFNDRSFDDILITWGQNRRGRKSIQLGSFDFDQNLVRLHPALDQKWVPRYFIRYVIYHELIHVIVPPEEAGSQRNIHSDEFHRLEREFSEYEKAMSWESENLHRLLESR